MATLFTNVDNSSLDNNASTGLQEIKTGGVTRDKLGSVGGFNSLVNASANQSSGLVTVSTHTYISTGGRNIVFGLVGGNISISAVQGGSSGPASATMVVSIYKNSSPFFSSQYTLDQGFVNAGATVNFTTATPGGFWLQDTTVSTIGASNTYDLKIQVTINTGFTTASGGFNSNWLIYEQA